MIYKDAWSLPVTKDLDGGDTAAILGTLLALDPKPEWSKMVSALFPDGYETPVRHPDKSKWYGLPWRFTRDQMIPLLCAFIVCRFKAQGLWIDVYPQSELLYKMHRRRKFLSAWNRYNNAVYDTPEEQEVKNPDEPWAPPKRFTDITALEIWALLIRLRRQELPWWSRWFFYILLNILDLETLVGTFLWSFKSKSNRVTRNHMLVTITSRRFWPTITSRINWELADFSDWLKRWYDHCEAVGESNTAPHFDALLRKMGR